MSDVEHTCNIGQKLSHAWILFQILSFFNQFESLEFKFAGVQGIYDAGGRLLPSTISYPWHPWPHPDQAIANSPSLISNHKFAQMQLHISLATLMLWSFQTLMRCTTLVTLKQTCPLENITRRPPSSLSMWCSPSWLTTTKEILHAQLRKRPLNRKFQNLIVTRCMLFTVVAKLADKIRMDCGQRP